MNVTTIIEATEDWFGLPLGAISTDIRDRTYSDPRHVAMYVARRTTGLSLPKLAAAFNRRDHTTVLYAVRKVEFNPKLSDCADEIERRLRVEGSAS